MDILRQCTFVDRLLATTGNNQPVYLDDLIEDRFPLVNQSVDSSQFVDFYLLLYFNADWLPQVSNSNLNKVLERFYTSQREEKKLELIFISSDKTVDAYHQFLIKNKFIRYALFFQDQDLKSQLCKYLNINGIPYLTVIRLKLDKSLKIVDFYADKVNIKHDLLNDELGKNFPWSRPKFESIKVSEVAVKSELIDHDVPPVELSASYSFLTRVLDKISVIGESESSKKLNLDGIKFVFVVISSSEILGSVDRKLVQSFGTFCKEFEKKHQFLFIYIDQSPSKVVPNDELLQVLSLNQLKWYTISDADFQKEVRAFYKINSLPRLVVLDIKTGSVLNKKLKQYLVEYVHEYTERGLEKEETSAETEQPEEASSSSTPPLSKPEIAQSEDLNDSEEDSQTDVEVVNIDQIENISFNLDKLNFNFDMFDLFEKKLFSKSKKSGHHANYKPPLNQRHLKPDILDELNRNLVDLNTGRKLLSSSQPSQYYLLYFCCNFTSNEILFDNVLNFLRHMQEKLDCTVRIVLISLDKTESDYQQLIDKYSTRRSIKKKVEFLDNPEDVVEEATSSTQGLAKRYALDYKAREVKDSLYKELNVVGMPWFSLVESHSGLVLCENLRLFILNSQLRDIVF